MRCEPLFRLQMGSAGDYLDVSRVRVKGAGISAAGRSTQPHRFRGSDPCHPGVSSSGPLVDSDNATGRASPRFFNPPNRRIATDDVTGKLVRHQDDRIVFHRLSLRTPKSLFASALL